MTRHKTRALKKLETDLQKLELREVVSNAVRDLATPVIGIEFESRQAQTHWEHRVQGAYRTCLNHKDGQMWGRPTLPYLRYKST